MTLAIVHATKALRLNGLSYENCPIILRDGGLDPVPSLWVTNLWMTRSQDTARSYAQGLKLFLSYLEVRGTAWWETNADDIELWQARMQLAGSSQTANHRISAVASFYRWAAGRGFLGAAPFIVRSRPKAAILSNVPSVRLLRTVEERPRYLTAEQYDLVLAHIPADGPEVVRRTELIFHCGRFMGLRRKEVAGLSASAFVNLTSATAGIVVLERQTTKGAKSRAVPVPAWLVHEIKVYIEVYRADTIARARAAHRRFNEPSNLFLTLEGRPITREYITKAWAAAAKAANVPSRFHMNRHWFGTVMVGSGKAAGHPNPLQRVAEMMGHVNTMTTSIYDHSPNYADGNEEEVELVERGWGKHASSK